MGGKIVYQGKTYSKSSLTNLTNAFLRSSKSRKKQARKFQEKLNKSRFASEEWLKKIFENAGIKDFCQNFPIGPYFADFFFPTIGVIVEADGLSHGPSRAGLDLVRDEFMQKSLIETVRVPYGDKDRADQACQAIKTLLFHVGIAKRREVLWNLRSVNPNKLDIKR